MDWIWWLAIGFVLGLNFGIAISAWWRFTSKRLKNEALRNSLSGSSLDGLSTIF
jgi:hypothetical protein